MPSCVSLSIHLSPVGTHLRLHTDYQQHPVEWQQEPFHRRRGTRF